MTNLLEITDLQTNFYTSNGVVRAVNHVNLMIERGKIQALVGESGCGKSMTALSILQLIQSPPGKIDGGKILFHPKDKPAVDLLKLSDREMRRIRGNAIAMIFQEPMTSLNPVYTIGNQIIEAIELHQKVGSKEARARAIAMLAKVGIPSPDKRIDDYPHQMSGGMRQRVMIAMGLSCHPELLLADEPTTALDVTIQAQILELMHTLMEEMGMTLLLITHDLGIVAEHADNVAVMYAGQIVEQASVTEIFENPAHPYTKGLMESVPSMKPAGATRLKAIPGMVPNLTELPQGCFFQARCERVQDDCRSIMPELTGDKTHLKRCYHPYS